MFARLYLTLHEIARYVYAYATRYLAAELRFPALLAEGKRSMTVQPLMILIAGPYRYMERATILR